MSWSFRIARILGIDVYLHLTFLLLLAWVGISTYLPRHSMEDAGYGVLLVLAVFAIVVLHELGHAMAARWFGIPTVDITLYPIGGVARLQRMPEEPKQELIIALAGPMVNVVLASILYLFLVRFPEWSVLDEVQESGRQILAQLFLVNVTLVLFNMIPAFPMDGGRVLRAILAMFMDHNRATQVAASLGQALAFGLGFLGLMGNPFLVFIAFFVWIAAGQEAQAAAIKSSLTGVPVSDAMITEYHVLEPTQPLSTAVNHLLSGFQTDFPVVQQGQVVGILLRHDLLEKLRSAGEASPVQNAMRTNFVVVQPDMALDQAFLKLQECDCRSMPVVHGNRLVGILTPDNVGEFLMLREALRRQ